MRLHLGYCKWNLIGSKCNIRYSGFVVVYPEKVGGGGGGGNCYKLAISVGMYLCEGYGFQVVILGQV